MHRTVIHKNKAVKRQKFSKEKPLTKHKHKVQRKIIKEASEINLKNEIEFSSLLRSNTR